MSRPAWIDAVRKLLVRFENDQWENLPPNVQENYSAWAASLAETLYDEYPDEYTPFDAVRDELSNA